METFQLSVEEVRRLNGFHRLSEVNQKFLEESAMSKQNHRLDEYNSLVLEELMDKVTHICISGGAISLGGDLGSQVIEAAIIYKGHTYTASIAREALHKSKQEVLKRCNEILENIINTKTDPEETSLISEAEFEMLVDRLNEKRFSKGQ